MSSQALSFTARSSGNRLLDSLSSRDLVDIERDVDVIVMQAHQSSLSAGEIMHHVHFPIDAVLSIIVTLDGHSIEVGTIGNESFVEGDAALDSVLASRSTICQVAGRVGRMATDVFHKRLDSPSFAKLMRKNVGTSFFCTQQYLACNAKHSTLARCARWLLMTADRARRTQFTLNRDFLGIMLSVHEDEMHQTIDELTRRGAITYARSDVTIVDVQLLEQISCGCYAVCKAAFTKSLSD